MRSRKPRPFRAARLSAVAVAVFLAGTALAQNVRVDEKLPEYRRIQGVSGTIKSVGSDTMNNLMTYWAEGYQRMYPNVEIEIEGKGSSTAPAALITGQATFGPMSREMKKKEQDEFEARYGYKATQLRTSIDMLAVYVNKDNPIKGLSLEQVDAIFSKTRKRGARSDIRTWGDVGLTGEWADKPISLYGRNSASGTYAFFKDQALGKGDFKDQVKEQPGSSAVVQGVASDRYAIGYSGIGYITADVLAVPLSLDPGSDPIPVTPEYAYTGEYPLARFLYLTVNARPGAELDPLRAEFLKFLYSRQGQEIVIKDGYFPVPAGIAKRALESVNLTVSD